MDVNLLVKSAALAGDVHPAVLVAVMPVAICDLVLSFLSARVFSKIASPEVHVKHVSDALYFCVALHGALAVLLVLRGAKVVSGFRSVMAQLLVNGLALMPAVVVTSLWAARLAAESLVLEGVTATHALADNPYVKASFALLTAAMVFVNLFAASAVALVNTNSVRFVAES
jgi:hypothetical protein